MRRSDRALCHARSEKAARAHRPEFRLVFAREPRKHHRARFAPVHEQPCAVSARLAWAAVRPHLELHALVLLAVSCTEAPAPRRSGDSGFPSIASPTGFLSPTVIGVEPAFDDGGDPAESREDAGWRAGDEIVYGINMQSPRHSQQWLVRIRVHSWPAETELADAPLVATPGERGAQAARDADEVARVLLEVETYDESGDRQDSRRVLTKADDMEHGMYPACIIGLEVDPYARISEGILGVSLDEEDSRTLDRSLATFDALFHLASDVLKPIVDTVVARPSIGQILLHRGFVRLTVNAGMLGDVERSADFQGIDGEILSFPFTVSAYESLALLGRMFVAQSRPPLLPAAGIVAIKAVHPTDSRSTVAVRLLSATRGPARTASTGLGGE